MSIKIEPRKPTDRGGYYCMPLRSNVPDPKSKDWELTHCSKCGAECWKNGPLAKILEAQGAKGFCTLCALLEKPLR